MAVARLENCSLHRLRVISFMATSRPNLVFPSIVQIIRFFIGPDGVYGDNYTIRWVIVGEF